MNFSVSFVELGQLIRATHVVEASHSGQRVKIDNSEDNFNVTFKLRSKSLIESNRK